MIALKKKSEAKNAETDVHTQQMWLRGYLEVSKGKLRINMGNIGFDLKEEEEEEEELRMQLGYKE